MSYARSSRPGTVLIALMTGLLGITIIGWTIVIYAAGCGA